jgi:hypothetical protein
VRPELEDLINCCFDNKGRGAGLNVVLMSMENERYVSASQVPFEKGWRPVLIVVKGRSRRLFPNTVRSNRVVIPSCTGGVGGD